MRKMKYRSYADLSHHERKNIDYDIVCQDRASPILIMAPHGGKIEEYTAELASEIAGSDFSCYSFLGKKAGHNSILHIASHRFDEPIALRAAGNADIIIAIHGHQSQAEEFLMIGGLSDDLVVGFERDLSSAGFACRKPSKALSGKNINNICNKGRSGKGVQFELSHGLRHRLYFDVHRRKDFIDIIRKVLFDALIARG